MTTPGGNCKSLNYNRGSRDAEIRQEFGNVNGTWWLRGCRGRRAKSQSQGGGGLYTIHDLALSQPGGGGLPVPLPLWWIQEEGQNYGEETLIWFWTWGYSLSKTYLLSTTCQALCEVCNRLEAFLTPSCAKELSLNSPKHLLTVKKWLLFSGPGMVLNYFLGSGVQVRNPWIQWWTV